MNNKILSKMIMAMITQSEPQPQEPGNAFAISVQTFGNSYIRITGYDDSKSNIYYQYNNSKRWIKYTKDSKIQLNDSSELYPVYLLNRNTQLSNAHIEINTDNNFINYLSIHGDIRSLINYSKTYQENQFEGLLSGFNCQSFCYIQTQLCNNPLTKNCFKNMFKNCKSVQRIRIANYLLSATILAESCYESMFENSDLINDELDEYNINLPATSLAKNCYKNMFKNCTDIYDMPKISAQILAQNCCEGMFENCTGFTQTTELLASTLVSGCYNNMFTGCTNLSCVTVGFTSWLDNAINNWLSGTASNGLFLCHYDLDQSIYDDSHIPTNWHSAKRFQLVDGYQGSHQPFTVMTDYNVSSNVRLTYDLNYEEEYNPDLEININDKGWTKYLSCYINNNLSYQNNNLNPYNYIRFRNNNTEFNRDDEHATYSSQTQQISYLAYDNDIRVFGNLMSFINYSNTLTKIGQFTEFFSNHNYTKKEKLQSIEGLTIPATTLTDGCYSGMFQSCINIKSSLSVLPAINLASYCYWIMFHYCTSLSSAPQLPATGLADSCYQNMFSYCTSLTTAPKLPASTLVYGCYDGMFSQCKSLSSIEAHFTEWKNNAISNWVGYVSKTGVFKKYHALPEEYGGSRIPYDTNNKWTIQYLDEIERTDYFTISDGGGILSCMIEGYNENETQLYYKTHEIGKFIPYVKNSIISTNINEYGIDTGIKLYNKTNKLTNAHIKCGIMSQFGGNQGTIYGNIASLINYSETIEDNQFEGLLSDLNNWRFTISELKFPFKTLSKNCYKNMFKNSGDGYYPFFSIPNDLFTNIETLAEGCFESMFEKSSIYCMNQQFAEYPGRLPLTTLTTNCYKNMFKNCYYVRNVELLAQTLASSSCYGMFEGCTNLTTLSTHFTDWKDDQNATTNWLSGTGNGTFYKESGLSTIIDNSHIPSNWTPKDYN